MSAILAIVLALICLAGGGLIGFFLARGGAASDAKRAEAVREEFDTYRRDVTAHFGETAEHFRTLGRQYRELYEHMASGAEALCDDDSRERLDFPSLRAIEAVAEAADDAPDDSGAATAPHDDDGPAARAGDAADEGEAGDATADDAVDADESGDGPAADPGADDARRHVGETDAGAANDDDVADDDPIQAEGRGAQSDAGADDAAADGAESSDSDSSDAASSDPDTLRRAGAT